MNASDLICPLVDAYAYISFSSPFTFGDIIANAIELLPSFTRPIAAQLSLDMLNILALVIGYKILKIVPTPW